MTGFASWRSLLLDDKPADATWAGVFSALADATKNDQDGQALESWLSEGDRILAEAAWDLWVAFPAAARPVAMALREWWNGSQSGGKGKAVLIVDALSLREMRLILQAARAREVPVRGARVFGSPVPSSTEAFAKALALSGRSQLKNSGYPASFGLADGSPYTDVPAGYDPFEHAIPAITARPRVVLWHPWLDDLIHATGATAKHVATTARSTLGADGFWNLIGALRQGREVVITADHGYAVSQHFVDVPNPLGDRLREHFGALRYATAASDSFALAGQQPVLVTADGQASIIGPRKWKVQGGFPQVGHGGLTLAEVCVPFIELEAA